MPEGGSSISWKASSLVTDLTIEHLVLVKNVRITYFTTIDIFSLFISLYKRITILETYYLTITFHFKQFIVAQLLLHFPFYSVIIIDSMHNEIVVAVIIIIMAILNNK